MERMVQTEDLIFEYAKRDEEGNVIGSYRAIDQAESEGGSRAVYCNSWT